MASSHDCRSVQAFRREQKTWRRTFRRTEPSAITLPRERLPGFRRRLGVVFQDFRLVPHLSAFDNVALPLRVALKAKTWPVQVAGFTLVNP